MSKATQGVNVVTPGGQNAVPLNSAALGAGSVIKNAPGVLCTVLVTANMSAVVTFFDNTAASGTVIGIIPATATAGQIFAFNMPANIGITSSALANTGSLTVAYN
jgi:hypothetical protein